MNSPPNNHPEMPKEREKWELSNAQLEEMKQKNARLMQRHAEVERDRRQAEEHNSAVTKAVPKKGKAPKAYDPRSGGVPDRLWDKGKYAKEYWEALEETDNRSSFRNFRTSQRDKSSDRKDNWGTKDSWSRRNDNSHHSRTEDCDDYKKTQHRSDVRNRRTKEDSTYKQCSSSSQVGASSQSRMSPKRSRGMGHNNESKQKFQSFSSDRHRRSDSYSYAKKRVPKNQSISTAPRDYVYIDKRSNAQNRTSVTLSNPGPSRAYHPDPSLNNENEFELDSSYLNWDSDKMSEDQNKQIRVERWVQSVNKSNNFTESQLAACRNMAKSYSKFDRYNRSPKHSSDDADFKNDKNVNTSATEKRNGENSRYFAAAGKSFQESRITNRISTPAKTFTSAPKQKTKRGPQYSSAGSSKNENFHKQRRFENRGFKNYDPKEKYSKSKSSTMRNSNSQSARYANYSTRRNDDWQDAKNNDWYDQDPRCNKQINEETAWGHIDQGRNNDNTAYDDGIWGNIDQGKSEEQYNKVVDDEDGQWGNVEQKSICRSKEGYEPDPDLLWGDYENFMSNISVQQKVPEYDDETLSEAIQDSRNAGKKSDCKYAYKKKSSYKGRDSYDIVEHSPYVANNDDDDVCILEEHIVDYQSETNNNKQYENEADNVWEGIEQSGNKWKLSDDDDDDIQIIEIRRPNQDWKDQDVVKLNIDSDDYDVHIMEVIGPSAKNPEKVPDVSDAVTVKPVSPERVIDISDAVTEKHASPEKVPDMSDAVAEKYANDSDGGWSTVSEGEIRSDDNGNEIEDC